MAVRMRKVLAIPQSFPREERAWDQGTQRTYTFHSSPGDACFTLSSQK